ncbi:MAG: hypothetical protein QS721_10465 [Candidatus Endonucleobacter sp. (ex Gigantidas childressi)]|nr:hypothetical protein [Candidatus Endonucleobacter sp. (ex Gigantidas childressi)]
MLSRLFLFDSGLFLSEHLAKIILFLLLLLCFGANSSLIPESQQTTLDKQEMQEIDNKAPEINWFGRQFDRVVGIVKNYAKNKNLASVSEYGRSQNNSARYLQYILDDNSLYEKLKAFNDKPVFEVLALVYIHVLHMVDILDKDILATELEVPLWVERFRKITERMHEKASLCAYKSKNTKYNLLSEYDQKKIECEFVCRANECFSILQTLLQHKVDTDETSSFIEASLDKYLNIILLNDDEVNEAFTKKSLRKQSALLNELLRSYTVPTVDTVQSMSQYPVLEALVNWGESNAYSTISDLLAISESWVKQNQLQDVKTKTHSQIFFSYLHNTSKVEWHDADQALRDDETNNIVQKLLSSEVVKSLIKEFQTVKLLAIAYSQGFESLKSIHNEQAQKAEILRKNNIDECLQDGIAQNIKESILGKVASGIAYAFNSIKSMFGTPLTKQGESQKAIINWVRILQQNALKVYDETGNKVHEQVMQELISANKKESDDITIADALAHIIKQRFTSKKQERVFRLLTGLSCSVDIKNKSYCCEPIFENCDLQQETDACTRQEEVIVTMEDGMHIPKSDYISQEDWVAQHNYSSDSSEECEEPHLHHDWYFIKIEDAGESNEHCGLSDFLSLSYSHSWSRIASIAISCWVISNLVHNSYAYSQEPAANTQPEQYRNNYEQISRGAVNQTSIYSHRYIRSESSNLSFSVYRPILTGVSTHVDRCPEPAEWNIMKTQCYSQHSADKSYMCLFNENNGKYTHLCSIEPDYEPAGFKQVLVGGRTRAPCGDGFYQPFLFWTNESSECALQHSLCNGEGQYVYTSGDTKIDNTCSCDSFCGYSFIVPPKNGCYCVPASEDCTCYKKPCPSGQVLTQDHGCMSVTNWKPNFKCIFRNKTYCRESSSNSNLTVVKPYHSKYNINFGDYDHRRFFLFTITGCVSFTVVSGVVSGTVFMCCPMKEKAQNNEMAVEQFRGGGNGVWAESFFKSFGSHMMKSGGTVTINTDGTVLLDMRQASNSSATNNQTLPIEELPDEEIINEAQNTNIGKGFVKQRMLEWENKAK